MDSANKLTKKTNKNSQLYQIGDYQYNCKDILGQGFSSKVYKGIHIISRKQVAIKVINNDILLQPINTTLLQSELQILSKMKGCSNVLTMHDIIKQGQDICIIIEICQTDLSKILSPLLPLQTVQKYTRQLIQGFYQFYRKQIIHRDLKPANLLIDKQGNLKIGDLGFAIKSSQVRKQIKFNIGSPLYMAPEVLKRNQYTHKSDVWAVGIILYEMLTGDTPWKAQNQQQLYQKYQRIRIQEILQNKKFPENINQLLIKTLQFQRRFRISPQDLILIKLHPSPKHKNLSINQQDTQANTRNQLYVPKQTKITRTQKFYKASINYQTLNKTTKQLQDEPIVVKIRPVTRKLQNYTYNRQIQNKTCLQQPKETKQTKQNTNSCTQTTGSTIKMGIKQNQKISKLTKQQAKALTKKLIYYIHISRLLYKILVRIDDCIQANVNQIVIKNLSLHRDSILKQYCFIIVKHLHQVKNFSNNNFLSLPTNHLDQYTMSSQYKKIKKACGQYIQRYSKSDELKQFWLQRQQADYPTALKQTTQIIISMWSELCQKNYNEIILLQFMSFAEQVLQALQKQALQQLPDKQRIQDYVDTIPNPPTLNRFKQAIAKAKKIATNYKLINQQVILQ